MLLLDCFFTLASCRTKGFRSHLLWLPHRNCYNGAILHRRGSYNLHCKWDIFEENPHLRVQVLDIKRMLHLIKTIVSHRSHPPQTVWDQRHIHRPLRFEVQPAAGIALEHPEQHQQIFPSLLPTHAVRQGIPSAAYHQE